MSGALVLTMPRRPRALLGPHDNDAALKARVDHAMRKALGGDFGELDRLELEHLNRLVRIGELAVRHADLSLHRWFTRRGASVAPFVVQLHRGAGPGGKTLLEWWLAEACRRCQGRLQQVDCRVCGGAWHVADACDEVLTTDTEGVLVYDEAAA